jgi:starvation-inducible DNA-binding protein
MILRFDRLGLEIAHDNPDPAAATEVAMELQPVLEALIDLSLIGKHAHWNVVGPNFRSLHLQLDELVDAWRAAADTVGERIAAVGGFPDGRADTVACGGELRPLGEGPLPDRELIASLAAILTDAVAVARESMDHIEDLDPVTADLLHSLVATLEEQLWMIRAQAG